MTRRFFPHHIECGDDFPQLTCHPDQRGLAHAAAAEQEPRPQGSGHPGPGLAVVGPEACPAQVTVKHLGKVQRCKSAHDRCIYEPIPANYEPITTWLGIFKLSWAQNEVIGQMIDDQTWASSMQTRGRKGRAVSLVESRTWRT